MQEVRDESRWVSCLIVALALALTGCGGTPQPTATATATTRPLPTVTLAPTDAPLPTATVTPAPTETPPPTATADATPEPTQTSADTPTPTAAATAIATPEDTPMPEETPTPEPTESFLSTDVIAINTITPAQVGQGTTVQGTVVGAASFSAGFKFTLDDGTGRIVLLMWHNVYDDCWDAPEINLGAKVRATGEIGQYEGELQIEPDFGGDVKAIEGATAWAAPREIGSLSGEDEGQRVMIEGEVIRVEGLSSAVKIFVSDDTGETLVFLWRTVLDRIPNNTALGTEGSRVRVVGALEKYKGNLEIVPTLPSDVTVLGMP